MHDIEKKIIAGIASISLASIVIGYFFYKSNTQWVATSKQVAHTIEVIVEIESTLSLIKDIETGQRGYVITGLESYLEPYIKGNSLIKKHFSNLQSLTKENIYQQNRLNIAAPLIDLRIKLSNQAINLRKNQGFEPARALIMTNQGKRAMDALRRIFAEMQNEEKLLLQVRSDRLEKSYQDTTLILGLLTASIFILLCLIYFLVQQYVISRMQLEAKLQDLAVRDELTGLYNRRELNRVLQSEVERFKRHHHPFGFILLDVDHFKSVNDTYGHQVGDQVLQWISQQVRANIRAIDLAARFGGEEIAVVLPNLDINESLIVAERIRESVANNPFKTANNPFKTANNLDNTHEFSVTLSAGVSIFTKAMDINSEADLIRAADQALYQAKHQGRNRVISA